MINAVDENNDGQVDFEEFIILMVKQLKAAQDKEEELVDVFRRFDIDGDNEISCEDLIQRFRELGEKISFEEA